MAPLPNTENAEDIDDQTRSKKGVTNNGGVNLSLFDHVVAIAASIFVPESLSLEGVDKWGAIASNNVNNIKYSWNYNKQSQSHNNYVQIPHTNVHVGDIILTSTPGSFMSIARGMSKNPFDHVVVVVENNMVLHVSPPQVRLLPLHVILAKKRRPLLLRPILNKDELPIFITNVKSFIGKRYNSSRAIALLSRIILEQQFGIKSSKPLSNKHATLLSGGAICTDVVFSSLCTASSSFRNLIYDSELSVQLDYVKQGSASFMDLVRLNRFAPRSFRYYPLATQGAKEPIVPTMKTNSNTNMEINATDNNNNNNDYAKLAFKPEVTINSKTKLPPLPTLYTLDDAIREKKKYTALQDNEKVFSYPFEKVALSFLNRYNTKLPDKRFKELLSMDVLQEVFCEGHCIYGHRRFILDTSFPDILKRIIGADQTNAIIHEECIFNFKKKELMVISYNINLKSFGNLYSRVTIKENSMLNNNIDESAQCILKESIEISVQGVPYLLQNTAKSYLANGAIKNYNRMIDMLDDRLKHFSYKHDKSLRKIFFPNEIGKFNAHSINNKTSNTISSKDTNYDNGVKSVRLKHDGPMHTSRL